MIVVFKLTANVRLWKNITVYIIKYSKKPTNECSYFVYLKMQHIQGISRYQLRLQSLEDTISQENPVLPKRRDYRCFCQQYRLRENRIYPQSIKNRRSPKFWYQGIFKNLFILLFKRYSFLETIRKRVSSQYWIAMAFRGYLP